ncbi:MAG: hypothetical protein ACRD92_07815 [Nitrosopumilaceae archaeon]
MQREFKPIQGDVKSQERFSSSTKLDVTGYQLKKEIVLFVVRQTILESGSSIFEMVNRSLFEKYRCEISDCFEKPEYLSDVLRYVFDSSHHIVIESITKNLDKFAQESGIKEFLDKIRQA